MAKIISYTVFILLFVTGCSTDETEYFPEDNVLVEVKAPQTDGWSTKDYINTRNYSEKTTVRKEEDGLNIKILYEVYKNSDVFVMPSVSEPFGIAPLEAMQCGTPSIISKQSGCGEILDKVIKTDYWDIHAMADAIYSICMNPSLFHYLQEEGKKEVDGITWEKVGLRIRALYEDVLRNYGK